MREKNITNNVLTEIQFTQWKEKVFMEIQFTRQKEKGLTEIKFTLQKEKCHALTIVYFVFSMF